MRSRIVFALMLCLADGSSVGAQAVGRATARALVAESIAGMRADSTLADSIRLIPLATLLGPSPMDHVGLLDDSGAKLYMRAMASLVSQLPDEICGKFLSEASDEDSDLDAMLAYGDSSAVLAWAQVLERIMRARASGRPGGPIASPVELQAAVAVAMGRLTKADQSRMLSIASNPPPSPADACWATGKSLAAMAALEPSVLGPIVRGMFRGAKPYP